MLEIKNLHKSFGDNEVLKGIDLTIEKGDRVAIIGPSGCGKSTLLRCMNLLEKPTKGQIIFENVNLENQKDLTKFRMKMGMVFQQFNLFPHLTVLENITLAPLLLKKLTKEDVQKKALKLLNEVGLKDKIKHYPRELSGGQQQRVSIVRALILNPDIMLFDEPTSALDPEMVSDVLELIEKIADEGMTIVIVSHEMNFVKNIATKVVFMDKGKITFIGTPKDAFSQTENIRLKEFLEKTNQK